MILEVKNGSSPGACHSRSVSALENCAWRIASDETAGASPCPSLQSSDRRNRPLYRSRTTGSGGMARARWWASR